jgi:hypothetical protein
MTTGRVDVMFFTQDEITSGSFDVGGATGGLIASVCALRGTETFVRGSSWTLDLLPSPSLQTAPTP